MAEVGHWVLHFLHVSHLEFSEYTMGAGMPLAFAFTKDAFSKSNDWCGEKSFFNSTSPIISQTPRSLD